MNLSFGIVFFLLLKTLHSSLGDKCKFRLPSDYVDARPTAEAEAPTEISVEMLVNDLMKVDDDELSYTIDITCVAGIVL